MVQRILLLTLLSFPLARHAVAQCDASMFSITVVDSAGYAETKNFGNHIGSTYGLDTALSGIFREPDSIPPTILAWWASIQAGQWGPGISRIPVRDFRGWSTETQIDTFSLGFCGTGVACSRVLLSWADSTYLRERCDSMILFDPYNSRLIFGNRLDMFQTSSILLNRPNDQGLFGFRIFKYGARLVDHCTVGTDDRQSTLPAKASLLQNYPNPFNPATEIQYSVARRQYVSIKIYDVLGREVATLVNDVQEPGFKSVRWDAEGIPSGVYFYRLQSGRFVETKKMVVLK